MNNNKTKELELLLFTDTPYLSIFSYLLVLETEFPWFICTTQTHFQISQRILSGILSQHFNFLLMHTTLKNVELLKHFKIRKTAPTCFGLEGNHHQEATVST